MLRGARTRCRVKTMLEVSACPVKAPWRAGASVMNPSRTRARHRRDHPCDRRLGRSQWATSPSLLTPWSASDTCASRRVRLASNLPRPVLAGAHRAGGLAYLVPPKAGLAWLLLQSGQDVGQQPEEVGVEFASRPRHRLDRRHQRARQASTRKAVVVIPVLTCGSRWRTNLQAVSTAHSRPRVSCLVSRSAAQY